MAWARSMKRWLGPKPRPHVAPLEGPSGDPAAMRRDSDAIFHAAVEACDPARAVEGALRDAPGAIGEAARVHVVGLGWAAAAMATGAVAALGDRVAGGLIVVPPGGATAAPEPIRRLVGGHPVPDSRSVIAGRGVLEIVDGAPPEDAVLLLLSSGGFSSAAVPREGLTVDDLAAVAALLQSAGAGVAERAVIRSRLCGLRGGGLAARRPGATTIALVLPDEAGGRPELIGGGPAAGDRARFGDAQAALRRLGVWTKIPLAVRGLIERGLAAEIPDSPRPGDPALAGALTRAVAGPSAAAAAARAEAERLGYEAQVLTDELAGDPVASGSFLSELARELAAARRPGSPRRCVVASGGLTARPVEGGIVAPCQTLALAAASALDGVPGIFLGAVSTRGLDGAALAAGAVVSGDTAARAREAGIDLDDALRSGGAPASFQALRDQVVTGPTGTAAGDLAWVLLA